MYFSINVSVMRRRYTSHYDISINLQAIQCLNESYKVINLCSQRGILGQTVHWGEKALHCITAFYILYRYEYKLHLLEWSLTMNIDLPFACWSAPVSISCQACDMLTWYWKCIHLHVTRRWLCVVLIIFVWFLPIKDWAYVGLYSLWIYLVNSFKDGRCCDFFKMFSMALVSSVTCLVYSSSILQFKISI